MIEVKTEIKKYLKYCSLEKKLSKHTLKAYRIDLAQFIAFKPDISISKEDLTKYIQYLHKTYKPKTIKRKIATLKAFVHYLYYKDIIEFNPFDKIDTTFKEPLHLPHTIPENIIHQLLTASYQNILTAATTHQKLVSVRNTAIIELLFATGARISEICSLKINNIDFASKTVRMSRVQVYRKIKAVTGMSPSKLILDIRLKTSLDMLQNTEYTVTEVSYRCGFNEISYFNR